MSDLAIIGGGVIGLSVAYEMSRRGAEVTVVDKPQSGAQASWAGGGILLPTDAETAIHPIEQLRALSSRLHTRWATELREQTGIDNGYRECGAVYFARSPGEVASLSGQMLEWTENNIRHAWLDDDELDELLPVLSTEYRDNAKTRAAILPDEWLIRNPDHLKALKAAGTLNRVRYFDSASEVRLGVKDGRVDRASVQTPAGSIEIEASRFLISAGAWSGQLVEPLGVSLPMVPVRGQMLLYKLSEKKFSPLVYEGNSYIIPRDDGHVLVGSTTEEAGFDFSNTSEEINRLKSFAAGAIPELDESKYKRCWSGLRPATNDSFPYLGQLVPFENLFVATGHFKWGLHLSPGTAVVMSDLIEGRDPQVDMQPFLPSRMSVSRLN
ncbi:MAG: FAD-dependent oxidoreductase [Planctomycetota bacterium]